MNGVPTLYVLVQQIFGEKESPSVCFVFLAEK